MSTFEIPASLIDPRILPPPLLTSEPGSFAYNTFKIRIPRLIDEAIELNTFPMEIQRALRWLRAEIIGGEIQPLRESAPDKRFWDTVSRPYFGRSWLDVPWYWAEAFFYRRLLEATRYFQPGPWHNYDPYAVKKRAEWDPEVAPQAVNTILQDLPADRHARFRKLLYASLWGNRVDLSYNVAAQMGRTAHSDRERANLLVDDSGRMWEFLTAQPRHHVIIITDNAGTELLMDLALSDFLLGEKLVEQIALHLKPQPFFVSDAMPRDVEAGLEALAEGGDEARALGERIRAYLESERLQLRAHWFYVTPLFYFQLPDDLREELATTDLVVLKGDVNYRRLLGDAHWSPTTPFNRVIAYFPTRCVALRTLKAELIVGLRAGEVARLREQDPEWMINGRRGLVQGRFDI